jgi:site-specific recombinase XerD
VPLLPSRGALASASVRNPDHAVTEREVNFIVKAAAAAPASTHRHAVWLRHTGASHAIDTDHLNQALGHADLET